MKVLGIIDEDLVNYKEPSMVIEFPYCNFKCDKECGMQVCQNGALAAAPHIDIDIPNIIKRYKNNDIVSALVCQGLEPFDSFPELYLLCAWFRSNVSKDPIIIYTGYTEDELKNEIKQLKEFKHIIIKFGRYIPNQSSHYDEILGVNLASSNQYAKIISK